MKMNKKTLALFMITFFLCSTYASAITISKKSTNFVPEDINDSKSFENFKEIVSQSEKVDIDPLVDLEVTVTIKEIRALSKIDNVGKADFYVIVYINDQR